MDLSDVVGFNLCEARCRENFKTFFYTTRFEGEAHSTLLWIAKGGAYFDFGKSIIAAKRGDLFCFEYNALRKAWGDPGNPPTYYILLFDIIDRLGGVSRPSDHEIPLLSRVKDSARLRKYMGQIIEVWREKRRNHLVRCASLGLELLQELENLRSPGRVSFSKQTQDLSDGRLDLVLDFIRRHYKEKLSVDTLAKKAGLHPATFRRLFRKATGMTPLKYILSRKIEQAKENLVMDNLPIWFANDDLGFSDYSNFHRTFKKFTGMTPSQYRGKVRATPALQQTRT